MVNAVKWLQARKAKVRQARNQLGCRSYV